MEAKSILGEGASKPDLEFVKRFWKNCFYYGLSRGLSHSSSEEFAQEAYFYKFVLGWHSKMWQFLAHFKRADFGSKGHARWRYNMGRLKQARYELKRAALFDKAPNQLNFVEEAVAVENQEAPVFLPEILTMREKMVTILLDAGFPLPEIEKSFQHLPGCLKKCLHSIQEKCSRLPELEEATGKNIKSLLPPEVVSQSQLRDRKQRSLSDETIAEWSFDI